jgi:hypothetical protein
MKKILIGFFVFTSSLSLTYQTNAMPMALKFKNCTSLNKMFPKGVAVSRRSARLTGARYSPSLYRSNARLDRDKDGVACERVNRKSPKNPGTSLTSPVTQTPSQPQQPSQTTPVTVAPTCESIDGQIVTQDFVGSTLSYKVVMSLPDIATTFEVSRRLRGTIRNNSSREVSFSSIVARSLYLNGTNRDSPTYEYSNTSSIWAWPVVTIKPNTSYEFSKDYTQYVSAPYGTFVDSFQVTFEIGLYTLNPMCDIDK